MRNLFIDIETYSSVDIKTSGLYKYAASSDFEILLISYAFDNEPVRSIDLASGEEMHEEFEEALFDENIIKHAHNATFERVCFKSIGYNIPIEQWNCTMVKSAYCGLPFSLGEVSAKLNIKNKKLDTGTSLIKYFSCPCKPTRLNGYRTRNMPFHNQEKWNEYKHYNMVDTEAEREIHYMLEQYELPQFEKDLYVLDQLINDEGIMIHKDLVINAYDANTVFTDLLISELHKITGLENPNSIQQLKQWIEYKTKTSIASVTAENVEKLIEQFPNDTDVTYVLKARQKLSKSSVKKYTAMLSSVNTDDRIRGLFQFYGASRTGRWAGRLVQLQNLPKNNINDIDVARSVLINRDFDALEMLYDDIPGVLSQLIRTSFISRPGHIFHIADFSAIEARVVSWLADEDWRLEVFRSHGKIYEAAGARMFNVPLESVTKNSDVRAKAKNAELALGYQGGLGAMKRMGGEKMGLSDGEMMSIVNKWRKANPKIVDLWDDYETCAHEALMYKTTIVSQLKNIKFSYDGSYLMIELPSGHTLFYRNPQFTNNKFGTRCISYEGIIQDTKQWGSIDTYGGKLTENIVQALSRDILGYSMLQLYNAGYTINMHVHDEVIAEAPINSDTLTLKNMCDILGKDIPWAEGLPLKAEGFSSQFYKKD